MVINQIMQKIHTKSNPSLYINLDEEIEGFYEVSNILDGDKTNSKILMGS